MAKPNLFRGIGNRASDAMENDRIWGKKGLIARKGTRSIGPLDIQVQA